MKIHSVEATQIMPPMGMVVGAPKVGKSSFCASIPNSLIVDLEGNGYDHIGHPAVVKPNSLEEIKEAFAYYFGPENKEYEMLVVDHLRELTSAYAKDIAQKNQCKMIDEVPFGKGTAELKHDMYTLLKGLRKKSTITRRVLLVAHSTDRNGNMRLDVDGKLDTMLTGMVDYIGNIYRAGVDNWINFTPSTGVEAGCRNKYLGTYNGIAKWEELILMSNG